MNNVSSADYFAFKQRMEQEEYVISAGPEFMTWQNHITFSFYDNYALSK